MSIRVELVWLEEYVKKFVFQGWVKVDFERRNVDTP